MAYAWVLVTPDLIPVSYTLHNIYGEPKIYLDSSQEIENSLNNT